MSAYKFQEFITIGKDSLSFPKMLYDINEIQMLNLRDKDVLHFVQQNVNLVNNLG